MTTVINGTSTSASAPAVVGDDSDTGIFYPTSNVVAIATAGAEIARANSTQLLIGTSTGAGSAAKTEIFASSTNPALFARAAGDISNQYGQALVLSDSAVPNLRANFIVQQIGGRGGLAIGATEVGVTNDRDIYIAYTGGILAVGGGTTVSTSKGAIQLNNTSYGGITFPASQVASSDANTLDDYEEGTWTPSFGSFDGTYSVRAANYTKVGKIVTIEVHMSASSLGTSSSSTISITGFPFAKSSGTPYGVSSSVHGTSWASPQTSPNVLMGGGATSASMYINMCSGGSGYLPVYSQMGTSGNLLFSMTYIASS